MQPLALSAYTLTSALGHGIARHREALATGRSGLRRCDFADAELDTWVGRVEGVEDVVIDGALGAYDCRNNRLARMALQGDGFADAVADARRRHGKARIGVFLGTSTSGIRETERAYGQRGPDGALPAWFHFRETQDTFSLADFVGRELDLDGPALVVSTACSSSAKVFAVAYRHMRSGLCDAAVVGGVDSLCLMTLYGFNALELVSPEPCRPWDLHRSGINIGEAAGFALLEWPDAAASGDATLLLGYGESSDAYHMSTPHPEGAGAALAMCRALASADLGVEQIDYLNLHGTATRTNDRSEDRAVSQVFGDRVPCSSTKGFTGHTLGAAGIVEAVLSSLALEQGEIPASCNTRQVDPELGADIVLQNRLAPLRTVMSNSFGFGGSNCSLVLGKR